MSCLDSPPPLELVLTNDPDGSDPYAANVVTLDLGNPPQQVRLTPSTSIYNIGVHIEAPCTNSSNPDCAAGKYGGIYDSTKSATYAASPFASWNGSHEAGQSTPRSSYYNEVVKFSDEKRLYGVPMVTLTNFLPIPNVLGIGTNSILVNQAYSAGLTTSKAWSLYAGTATTPGSLILGGYSDQFISGNLTGITTDISCPLCFQVSSITFDTVNGSVPVLRSGQGSFTAQFEPYTNFLAFPDEVYRSWLQVTNGTMGIQDFATYHNGSVPYGNLTVTLSSGIKVTIPNDDLFTSNAINGNGSTFTPEAGSQLAKVAKSPSSTGFLGFPYMSHVYVIYDRDRQTLNVSNAVPNAVSDGKFTRICPLPTSTVSNSTQAESSQSSYAGPIAGGVVGFAVLLAAIVAIVFLFLRHRRKQLRRRPSSDASNLPLEKDTMNAYPLSVFEDSKQVSPSYRQVTHEPIEMSQPNKVEMPAGSPTYELPTSNMRGLNDLNYERYELPSDSPAATRTEASWGVSTLPSYRGRASSETPQPKISPQWNYI